MTVAGISKEVCDTKHKQVLADLAEIKDMLKDLYNIVKGNGKPGLRETQAEIESIKQNCERAHEERRVAERRLADRRDSWIMFLLKPFWPYVPPALFFGLWFIAQRG